MLILLISTSSAYGASLVSGPINTDTTWAVSQAPFVVDTDVIVSNGATLTIEPGVVVYMKPGANLIIGYGSLRAVGTSASPIVITSVKDVAGQVPSGGDWGQLVFRDNTNDANTIVEWAQIKYGRGILVESSSPTLNYLTLQGNAGSAISIDLNSSPLGHDIQANGNTVNGVSVPSGEIQGSVQWRLQGIPYVVSGGEVSVGAAPRITGISPSTIQQGQTIDAAITGTRLTGADAIDFDGGVLSASVSAGTDTSIPVHIAAPPVAPLGAVPFTVKTAAGNVRLEVGIAVIPAKPNIAVSGIAPGTIRRAETKNFTITGSSLLGAQVIVPTSGGLTLSGLTTTDSQAAFSLAAGSGATLGNQTLSITNPTIANGTATATVAVGTAYPQVYATPAPLAVPPDGGPHSFSIRLTDVDTVDHTLNLAMADTSVASVLPATVVIPAGQSQVTATITGVKAGTTSLLVTSPTLASISAPIYVTSEFSGMTTGYSFPLGVVFGGTTPAATTVTPISSPLLGIVIGSVVTGVSPNSVAVGSGPQPLMISGVGLTTAQSITITPPDGLTLGAVSVQADGNSVVIPVTVAPDAAATSRRITVVSSSGQAFPAVAGVDRIAVVLPTPQIDSVAPIVVTPSTTFTLTVRGRNLQSAQSVDLIPATGMTVGATPTVNSDGTQLTVGVTVAADAPAGPRVVTVTTPGGTSTAALSAANKLSLVSQTNGTMTPVASPTLGVVFGTASAASPSYALYGLPLGVAVGSVVSGIEPSTAAIGTTVTLTIRGSELQTISGIQVSPSTGITIGATNPSPDGKSVSVTLTIAADAPQAPRTLILLKGATPVPFANPAASQFLVTAPQPRIDSVSPIVLGVGVGAMTLTVRGANFQNAQQVRLIPPDSVSISSPPTVNSDGSQLTVSVSADASAATGQRVVIVGTPAGETGSTATSANTLTLAAGNLGGVTPVAAPLLGVVVQDATPVTTTFSNLSAPLLGVTLGNPSPATSTYGIRASALGIALGPVATAVTPLNLALGGGGILTITGAGLSAVTSISVSPAQGVSIGSPLVVAPDGGSVSVPISVDSAAAVGPRAVVLTAGSTPIPFGNAAASRVQLGAPPSVVSMTPILGYRGTTLTLVISGQKLDNTISVTATPPDGITFAFDPQVNAAGTQVTVGLSIVSDAPTGPRVIRVNTPGGATSAVGGPENTFTVYAP